MKTNKIKEEIEKKFYKLKYDDKLTLTGKQLKEFAEFNIKQATADLIKMINKKKLSENEVKILINSKYIKYRDEWITIRDIKQMLVERK